jgi:ABC-2 type transport system permease protein
MGITYAITIFSYLWNGFGGLIESIESTTNLSPFYHYSGLESQGSGVNLVEVIVVFLLSISFVMISIAIFNKRDIGT